LASLHTRVKNARVSNAALLESLAPVTKRVTLLDALYMRYDQFYATQIKSVVDVCLVGYSLDNKYHVGGSLFAGFTMTNIKSSTETRIRRREVSSSLNNFILFKISLNF